MTLKTFIQSDSGAVTVDWVVLTAALVGLGLATTAVVSGGVSALSSDMDDQLVNQGIITEFAAAVAAMDWASYDYLAAQHGPSWGTDAEGRGWAEHTYAQWSDPNILSDAELMAQYQTHYAYATTGSPTSMETQTRADYIAIQEQIMLERGLEIPEGNQSAEEVRERFS
ncbi:hypothetical protein [Gymnodinialimonas sp.]